METNLLVLLVIIFSLVIGIVIGIVSSKIYNYRRNKKIVNNAKEVLENKRKNVINIDGKEYEATKFIVRDDNDDEILIDLKGGNITKNETKKESIKKSSKNIKDFGKDSGSIGGEQQTIGEKKRTLGNVFRRRRRRFC